MPPAAGAALAGAGALAAALAGCSHSSAPHAVSLPPGTRPLVRHAAAGTYVGPVAVNKYGPVQVAIVVSSRGRLTRALARELPFDRARSRRLSDGAAPTLAREALIAQSARIDTVSGATYTSESYGTSLAGAIAAADRARR